MYCTAAEVYATTLLDSTIVSEAEVNRQILAASEQADNFTYTTYWDVKYSNVAVSSTDNVITILEDDSLTANLYKDFYIYVYQGAGVGQVRKITANDETTITVDRDYSSSLDDTSYFRIFYSASDPRVIDNIDGSGTDTLYLDRYPLQFIDSISINSIAIPEAQIFQYKKSGKLQLKTTAPYPVWYSLPQTVALDYWYGVYPLPSLVKRYCIVLASLKTLASQMGGTYNVPSTYSAPEGSITIGQAYINIRGTYDVLMKEQRDIERDLIKYPVVF